MAADPFSEIKKAKEEAKKRREGKIIKTNSANTELEKAKAQNKTSRRVKDSLKLEQEKALSKTDKFEKTNPAFKELEKAKREANIRRYKRTQPEVKAKPAPKPAPKKAAPKAERAKGSEGYKPTKTDIGPNMNKVNKPDAKADTRSTMEKLFGVSEERRQMGRDLQKKAQASMGFKRGGNVKGMGLNIQDQKKYKEMAERDKPAVKRMLEEKPKRPTKAAASMGFKKGGSIDGCAVRGHTRAKHR